jgi:hypothetical protein
LPLEGNKELITKYRNTSQSTSIKGYAYRKELFGSAKPQPAPRTIDLKHKFHEKEPHDFGSTVGHDLSPKFSPCKADMYNSTQIIKAKDELTEKKKSPFYVNMSKSPARDLSMYSKIDKSYIEEVRKETR